MPADVRAILKRLESRRSDHKRRTSAGDRFGGLYQPASAHAVRTAEQSLGYALPPLLKAIYLSLANGGFGPGFGLLGVHDGYATADGRPLVAHHDYLKSTFGWPNDMLTVCHLANDMSYAIDCALPDFPVYWVESAKPTDRVGPFDAVMENWAAGYN